MKIIFNGEEIGLPEGATLEVVDGQIVFTPKQEEFNDGDVLHAYRYGFHYYCIYKSLKDCENINYYAFYNETVGKLRYDDYCCAEGFYLASEKEKQMLFDVLKKDEKLWIPVIRRIIDLSAPCVSFKEVKTIADILKEMRGFVNENPKNWDEVFMGKIKKTNCKASKNDISTFHTEKQAKSALAYAQLTQLMALPCYNGDWEADWENGEIEKYAIRRAADKLSIANVFSVYHPIAFKTPGIRDAFLVNNQELLKQYFQL